MTVHLNAWEERHSCFGTPCPLLDVLEERRCFKSKASRPFLAVLEERLWFWNARKQLPFFNVLLSVRWLRHWAGC